MSPDTGHEFVLAGWKDIEGTESYMLPVAKGTYLRLTPMDDDTLGLSVYHSGPDIVSFDNPVVVDIGPYREEIDALLPEIMARAPSSYLIRDTTTGSRQRALQRLGNICARLTDIDNGKPLNAGRS